MSTMRTMVWCALAGAVVLGCDKDGGNTQPPSPASEGAGQDIGAGLQEANREVEESVDEANEELEGASEEVDEEIGGNDPD